MAISIQFGRRSTADHVLAGIDLTGRHIVVTGCNSGLGRETMNAFAANGASVIGMARTLESASRACAQASRNCIPVGCDLSHFESIAAALDTIRKLSVPLDAIVANAAAANLPSLEARYGVEMQFLTNHLGHFMLVNGLADVLRDGSARIVMVSSGASISQTPSDGIMFDNLDGRRFYDPSIFYAQSKLANALYAKELSRRLAARGIAVNSADPGAARTRIRKGFFVRLFAKQRRRRRRLRRCWPPAHRLPASRASTGRIVKFPQVIRCYRTSCWRGAFGMSRRKFSIVSKAPAARLCSRPLNFALTKKGKAVL